MVKRLLDCTASDYAAMSAADLKQAIYAAEGRTILSENVVSLQPIVDSVTNSEIAAFAGADLILLNAIDLNQLEIKGLPATDGNPISALKRLVGKPIGINLEPVAHEGLMSTQQAISTGRQATLATIQQAEKLGVDYICLTGNPGTGVNNAQILATIKLAKQHFSGLIIAGKMHSSGVDEPIINAKIATDFIAAGVDILLVPALYTVPRITKALLAEVIQVVDAHNTQVANPADKVLTMATIGTSQESSPTEVITKIALEDKALGIDIHHIGDAGYAGIAFPENINALGLAVRGERHQLRIRARSLRR
ncbi:haloacid dehalogenase-like hydrolase [Lactiplantibacillus nangangensis]|uniref:Haloacid dehalogenase-like hydrolase n=1 Tax=Lactiplantibacillus nangangensis TaxID=2559917 RepID=A0ABW1SNJ5_9LACO|nr:haloacid dehalogenase-like hydrolase [Lactiplantibacillus nangangensis]